MKHTILAKKAKLAQDDLDVSVTRLNVPVELQQRANAFLNSNNVNTNVLQNIVYQLKDEQCNAIGLMHVFEVIFKNLLKRKCIGTPDTEEPKTKRKTKAKDLNTVNSKCHKLYNEAWTLLLIRLGGSSKEEAGVAIKVCMQLLSAEAKYLHGPNERLRSILETFINSETTPPTALNAFKQYANCLDIVQMTYQLLPDLLPSDFVTSPKEALNYLAVVNLLDLGKSVLNAKEFYIKNDSSKNTSFDYEVTRKHLNMVWNGIMASNSGQDEKVHRQVLIVLLERIISHLENPILLTDFLMDSLHQFDGAIALLALQGIFTLMQEQNITYPDVYTKLYNLFYPRMFYNKYKARLFYLADLFLTSTHLPENLVAAFVKRLARLALKSPTEDAILMIHFICNLLLRHTGLQRLINATTAASAVEISDPYNETEVDPVKSGALNSSLWEMLLLQKHAVPEVANAARFISKSLPVVEHDLTTMLEMKECEIFDKEVIKEVKQFAMAYERPTNFALPKNDVVTKYWNII